MMQKRGFALFVTIPLALSLAGCQEAAESSRGRLEAAEEQPAREEKTEEGSKEEGSKEEGNKEEGNKEQENNTPAGTETDSSAPAEDHEQVYAPVFSEMEDIFANGYDYDQDYVYLPTGLMEALMYRGTEEVQQSVGYLLRDINGDDIPELLIGENAADSMGEGECAVVYGGYSIAEGAPCCFLDGYARSSYQWMGDGSFYYFGSGGASNSLFGECSLGADGKELVWKDFYFSEERNGKPVYFHNTTGETDMQKSEELKISDEEFWGKMEGYRTQTLPWESFAAGEGQQMPEAGGGETGADLSEYMGTWLYPSGAALELRRDGTWSAYDDVEKWLFDGTWILQDGQGPHSVCLYSQVGDAGNNALATATF
ncbi:MAG: hypothetical protein IJ600_12900, partial [Lachnospiraceae bacterium]|nr:hypothetical protein [Lachnospiraceae bacterium]